MKPGHVFTIEPMICEGEQFSSKLVTVIYHSVVMEWDAGSILYS